MHALLLILLAAVLAPVSGRAEPASAESGARVEARSSDFLAVGSVRGERMVVHLSRVADNAPVRDASLSVALRGTIYPATAEADGSYSIRTKDLTAPGAAAVVFDVTQGTLREQLTGTLELGAAAQESHENSRQLLWWVLNSAVCLGFLWLWNRRRRPSEDD